LGSAGGYHHEFHMYESSQEVATCVSDSNLLTNELKLFGNLKSPNPAIQFDFSEHGRFASNSDLIITWSDNIWGDTTCNVSGDFCLLGFLFCENSGIDFAGTSLYTAPYMNLSASDTPNQYTEFFSYTFDTKQGVQAAQEAFNSGDRSGCAQTFIFFGLCDITNLLISAISWVFGIIGKFVLTFLAPIPFIGAFFSIIGIGIASIGTAIITFLNLIFIPPGNSHTMAEVIWMHIIILECIACIATSLTGRYELLLTLPFYVIKGTIIAFAFIIWALFIWVPLKVGELIGLAISKLPAIIPI